MSVTSNNKPTLTGISSGAPQRQRKQVQNNLATTSIQNEQNRETKLTGVAAKKWLFVTRVSNEATSETVSNYIRNKLSLSGSENFPEITVQKMGSGRDFSSFKVGIEASIAESLKKGSFWPQFVIAWDYRYNNIPQVQSRQSFFGKRNHQRNQPRI